MDTSDPRISHLFLIGVVLLWGPNVGVVKFAYQEVYPILFAAVRFTLSGIPMLLIVLWRERGIRIDRSDRMRLLMVGGLGLGLYQILWSLGLHWTSATNSALLVAAQPLMGAIYVDFTKKETVPRRRYLGMLLAFGGVALVILKPTMRLHFSVDTFIGDFLTLLAGACIVVFFTAWSKPLLKTYCPMRLMGYCMCIGAGVLWMAVPFCPQLKPAREIGGGTWAALIYASAFAGMLGHTFWYAGIGRLGVTKTLVYLYLIPVWATLFNHFFMGESVYPQQIFGGALILLGIHYALRD
jgi:drug/metabolite transporter (DMT)-like permease